MYRSLRIEYPDAWHHVMSLSRVGQEAFPAEDDYYCFIGLLKDTAICYAMKVSYQFKTCDFSSQSFAAAEICITLPPFGLRFIKWCPVNFSAVKQQVEIRNKFIQMADYG